MTNPVHTYHNSLNNFCIVGINYRKSDMNIRGKFSLTQEQSEQCLKQSIVNQIPGCLVLSTCNRTEIYGIANEPDELSTLICDCTNNSMEDFTGQRYVYRGLPAIKHLFKVASGLDSQIIGDYEILSQLKLAAKMAKDAGCLNSFMERGVNYAFQVSKEIKTKTKLSSGTVSVSYAAIEILKERIKDFHQKRILLVGLGKFGNHIAQNLNDYLPGASIFFANRTNEKARELAAQFGAGYVPFENLSSSVNDADVIIASATAKNYTIVPSFFNDDKPHLILDLSVPQNVDPAVKNKKGITLLNVDEVSQILDKTISERQSEVPKALAIIDETLDSLEDWHRMQANNPLLRTIKSRLFQLSEIYNGEDPDDEQIHKVVSALAINLKEKNNKGCQAILALNSYLQTNYEKAG